MFLSPDLVINGYKNGIFPDIKPVNVDDTDYITLDPARLGFFVYNRN